MRDAAPTPPTAEPTVPKLTNQNTPAERKRVRPALPNSYEALFHAAATSTHHAQRAVGAPATAGAAQRNFLLLLHDDSGIAEQLRAERLEHAIGVIYRPETERASHYFRARLADQFDALIHFDETRAVEPLERSTGWVRGEVPETFPTGQ